MESRNRTCRCESGCRCASAEERPAGTTSSPRSSSWILRADIWRPRSPSTGCTPTRAWSRWCCTYDYERNPAHGYPAAHVQVNGHSPALDELCQRAEVRKELKDLHLPVGGRRFRPTLEDLIEFLIIEGFAEARSDWRRVLERPRRAWEERQLRAAVRRHPGAARRELDDLDRR